MLINLGSRVPFTDSFPARQATRSVALHSTLLALLGEKSGRWSASSSPHHGAFSSRSCAHRFAPKWSALTVPRQSVTRLPRSRELHGLARSATIRSLKVEWTSQAMRMRWNTADRSRKRARAQWARMHMPLNLKRNLNSKLLEGFIGNGDPPPPPPPPPVYAPDVHASHAASAGKMKYEVKHTEWPGQRSYKQWPSTFTLCRTCLLAWNIVKWRKVLVNRWTAEKGEWKVRTLFRWSAGPSSSPRVAVFMVTGWQVYFWTIA